MDLKELTADLGPIFTTSGTFLSTLYCDLATTQCIDAFLDAPQSPFVRNRRGSGGRWRNVPRYAKVDSSFHAPLMSIIEQVMRAFSPENGIPVGVSRVIHDIHDDDLRHENGLKLRPDFVVVAEGPSFETPSRDSKMFKGLDGLGYANTASVFEVSRERSKDLDQDKVVQIGHHCQQIFARQPNRNFCRAIIITEKTVRLVHYDRTGTYITPACDYHQDPYTFVRLVLGLTSTDENVLGFDTSIQWTIKNGKKVSGTITTTSAAEANPEAQGTVVYDLAKINPVFSRPNLCGRGTTCWLVEQSGGKNLMIKDAWRTDTRMAEHHYLDAAKSVSGVVQMISYQYLCQTSDYRPSSYDGDAVPESRRKLRIVMEVYGPDISRYKSRYQLVSALRSAIKAHRNLHTQAGVLHRDISILNILLGDEDSLDAFLIDMDMAIFHENPPCETSAQKRTGTRNYQSIEVLRSYFVKPGHPFLPHDYLDDIESFLYVLCEIMFTTVSEGKEMHEEARQCMKRWVTMGERVALESKLYFIRNPFDFDLVDEDYWGKACVELLEGFHDFIERISWEKSRRRVQSIPFEKKVELWKALRLDGKLEEYYDEVDALFEKALHALRIEEPEIEARLAAAKRNVLVPPAPSQPLPPSPPPAPSPLPSPAAPPAVLPTPVPRRPSKRRLPPVDDAEVVEPPIKRRSTRIKRRVVPFVNWK